MITRDKDIKTEGTGVPAAGNAFPAGLPERSPVSETPIAKRTGTEMPREARYTGNSMKGEFTPGEMLILAETAFESLRTGDVVAIFDRTPYYVHRIIEKNADCAVTMGDNNGHPDRLGITPDSSLKLVTGARGLNGTVRQVGGGGAGMEHFRRQQRKRNLHRVARLLLSPFMPLKFLRIPARNESRFRDGTVQWSFGPIPVAARTAGGKTKYLHWSERLFFRIPDSAHENRANN